MGNVSKRVKYEKDYYLEYFSCWYFNRTLSIDGGQKDVFEGQYKKLFLAYFLQEHEFVRHHLGVIFAVASNNPNPVESLRNLAQLQHKQQHENRASTYPQYLSVNILKYYVLVSKI